MQHQQELHWPTELTLLVKPALKLCLCSAAVAKLLSTTQGEFPGPGSAASGGPCSVLPIRADGENWPQVADFSPHLLHLAACAS